MNDKAEMALDANAVENMTDRELLVELVSTVRELKASVAQFQSGGMGRMLAGLLPNGKR